VDVVLTQVFDKKDPSPRALSDTVLRKVRIIAIDQEIQEGGRAISTLAGKLAQTVSLELTPEQVKKITVAKQLGTLSLAVRAAVEQWDTADTGVSNCGVSPEIPLHSAAVVFYSGGEVKQYSVKKQDSDDSIVSCDGLPNIARQTATAIGGNGKLLEKR
jgi:pilus assembly protein CpaB